MNDGMNSKWSQMSLVERSVQRGAPLALFLATGFFASLLLQPVIPGAYAVILVLAAGGCGWVGRRALGVLAGAIASVLIEYFFLEPTGSFRLHGNLYPEAALLSAAAISVGWQGGRLRNHWEKLQEGREQFRICWME